VSVSSPFVYDLQMSSGARHYGTLASGPEPGTLTVKGDHGEDTLKLDEVVGILPIKSTFLQRLDGSVSLGATILRAEAQKTFNFDADVKYIKRQEAGTGIWQFQTSSTLSARSGSETTRRNVASVGYRFLLENKWFPFGVGQAERNDSLGLDLRWSLAGGAGRNMVATNHDVFKLLGGLSYNNETYVGEEPAESAEALLGAQYEMFEYDYPKKNLHVGLLAFPSLTVSGRVRGQLDVGMSFELVRDFMLTLSAWDSYDSKPPEEGLEKNDYGFTTSLGWTF
jgi:hypothetical protein